MPPGTAAYSTQVYHNLLANPIQELANRKIEVYPLPANLDGDAHNLYFAAGLNAIAIHPQALQAGVFAGHNAVASILISPRVSTVRPYTDPPAIRFRNAWRINALAALGADLWVTEIQTGCTVVIIEWAGPRYSLVHLQPYDDATFNRFGRALMWMGGPVRAAYHNAWLRNDVDAIVAATGRNPRRYIMVQSMFEATWHQRFVQVIGVRTGHVFNFYRQQEANGVKTVTHLAWTNWTAYPWYSTY